MASQRAVESGGRRGVGAIGYSYTSTRGLRNIRGYNYDTTPSGGGVMPVAHVGVGYTWRRSEGAQGRGFVLRLDGGRYHETGAGNSGATNGRTPWVRYRCCIGWSFDDGVTTGQ